VQLSQKRLDSRTRNESIRGLLRHTRNSLCLTLSFLPTLSFLNENIVLTYHSVSVDGNFHTVKPKDFARQLEYLKQNYEIVSLAKMLNRVDNAEKTKKRFVSITFDDGYQDFYLNVYPLLRKNKLPATVFVATSFVGKKWPFAEEHPKMLTWKQIEEISNNNIEIGAHTVTHPNLQKKKREEAEQEITESKEEIENHLGKCVNFFSYPFGRYSPEIVDIVRRSGFKGGVGAEGTVRKDAQLFVLDRIQVDSSVSFILFKARLTKAIDMSSSIEQALKKLFSIRHPIPGSP
jgi:peptidoglycan/xylan/chitin deacetylase (PgdA/CDA1 family)